MIPEWHLSVVIPARNEEELVAECLTSVIRASRRLPANIACDVVLTVDRSTDRTLLIAQQLLRHKGVAVCVESGVVGEVRAVGTRVALQRCASPLDRCWLANTDADTIVPENWLLTQLELAQQGIQAVAGTIGVASFAEHHRNVAERFRRSYLIHEDGGHPHVHGANLGVRADCYLAVGGWSSLETAEDHDLWDRLGAAGAVRRSISHCPVTTSGRRMGRAPLGFAQTLAALNEDAA